MDKYGNSTSAMWWTALWYHHGRGANERIIGEMWDDRPRRHN